MLSGAIMIDANLSDAVIPYFESDFRELNECDDPDRHANLGRTDLSGANSSRADLTEADLLRLLT